MTCPSIFRSSLIATAAMTAAAISRHLVTVTPENRRSCRKFLNHFSVRLTLICLRNKPAACRIRQFRLAVWCCVEGGKKSGPVLLKNEAKVGGANNHRQDYCHSCALERRRRSRCSQRRGTLTHSRLRGIDWARQSLAQSRQAAPGAAPPSCSGL